MIKIGIRHQGLSLCLRISSVDSLPNVIILICDQLNYTPTWDVTDTNSHSPLRNDTRILPLKEKQAYNASTLEINRLIQEEENLFTLFKQNTFWRSLLREKINCD